MKKREEEITPKVEQLSQEQHLFSCISPDIFIC